MSQKLQVTCDECGILKGEDNRWYKMAAATRQLQISAWSEGDNYSSIDLCCVDCVIKAVNRRLENIHDRR